MPDLREDLAALARQVKAAPAPTLRGAFRDRSRVQPRSAPTGLREVVYRDASGKNHRAWVESIECCSVLYMISREKSERREIPVATLCVELRPGKFASISGVPSYSLEHKYREFFNEARWIEKAQAEALEVFLKELDQIREAEGPPGAEAAPAQD